MVNFEHMPLPTIKTESQPIFGTKKILYFFPANPNKKGTGNAARALELLKYFNSRKIQTDFIYNLDHWGGPIDEKELCKLTESGLVNGIYSLKKKPAMREMLPYLFQYKLPKIYRSIFRKFHLSNFVTIYSKSIFNKILKREKYDYIIISYAFWAHLIKNNPYVNNARLIIDTHDLLTSQQKQESFNYHLGRAFGEEMERLDFFDEIWAISSDEQFIFSQFCRKPVRLVTIGFNQNFKMQGSNISAKYDLIFVGGDNPHNITGMNWFFKEVYPLLPHSYKICIIGKINQYIKPLPNCIQIPFAENLDDYYYQAKIAICPLLSGTGIKVKVIEALSYGLPVICTPRGVDGMPNKLNNGCLVSENAAQFADNINHLITDSESHRIQEKMAQETFRTQYTTDALYRKLDAIFF
ncbi:Glycosyltransferase involved in cell wall bisynthesis [bacterium A37T11]|nr:Glycosyltransferase involved in cell wall bisynthesis [bacterium A37T11]